MLRGSLLSHVKMDSFCGRIQDIPPVDKMATFYSIHAYDQESRYHAEEDRINNGKLYATFEKACEEIETKILDHIKEYDRVFEPPNREDKEKYIRKRPYVHYYECESGWLWVIKKWEVET